MCPKTWKMCPKTWKMCPKYRNFREKGDNHPQIWAGKNSAKTGIYFWEIQISPQLIKIPSWTVFTWSPGWPHFSNTSCIHHIVANLPPWTVFTWTPRCHLLQRSLLHTSHWEIFLIIPHLLMKITNNYNFILWKLNFEYVKPLAFGPVYIQNTDSILDNEGLRPLCCCHHSRWIFSSSVELHLFYDKL